jgi:hypothetical protein
MTLTLATLTMLLAPGVVIGAVYCLARGQTKTRRRRLASPPDWTTELSADRYRPMLRLLDEGDIRFLRSQPGATAEMINRLRRHRYRVFRGYLRELQHDFERASGMLMLLAVHSQHDRADILRALMVRRLKFFLAVVRVRWRLLLYRWNVARVPVDHLVGLFESLQLELLAFDPASQNARA